MFKQVKVYAARVAQSKAAKRAVAGCTALAASASALAVPVVDYSSAVTTATAEIGTSVATALPLFGTVMAIGIGIRIMHKFSKG